jgi:hypothetical protein
MFSAGRRMRLLSLGFGAFLLSAFCSAAAPPSVALSNVAVGSNNVLTIQGTASDSDGTVTKVEFYASDFTGGAWSPWMWIGETNAIPYYLTWQSAGQNYNIIAVATDNSGLRSTSTWWQVCAWLPPRIRFIAPPTNELFASGSPIHLTVAVDYAERPVQRASFYFNQITVTVTQAPFTATWTNPPSGQWQVTASVNDECRFAQTNQWVTVVPGNGLPLITANPISMNVATGQMAMFTVEAAALTGLRYFWLYNGTMMEGQTNSSLAITNVQAAHAGTYSVLVMTDAGTVSRTAGLTVIGGQSAILPADGLPLVTANPVSVNRAVGQTATFTVEAQTLTPPLRYQWRHHGTNLPGETNSSLVIADVQQVHAGPYSALAMTDAGAVPSLTAWLNLTGAGVRVQFSIGPISTWQGLMGTNYRAELWAGPSPHQLAQIGSPVTPFAPGYFSGGVRTVTTVTAPNPVYCQVRFRLATGEPVVNSSLRPYPPPEVPPVVLTNLIVPTFAEWPNPWLVRKPEVHAPVTSDFPLTLQAWSFGNLFFTRYQWHKDGLAVGPSLLVTNPFYGSLQTNLPLTLTNLQPDDAASYTVLASNFYGFQVSDPVQLSVVKRPIILQSPLSRTVLAGTNVDLGVVAGGASPLNFQWRRWGTNIPGASSTNIIFNPITPDDAGAYDVIVQNSFGSATSQVAQLTVLATPFITNQPMSQTVFAGTNVTLQVGAVGPGLTYQWRLNGLELPNRTNAALVFSNVQPTDEGIYSVFVSNQYGGVTSTTATLTVLSAPLLLTGLSNVTLHVGMNASLAATVVAAPPVFFTWMHDGAPLPGPNSSSLQFSNVQPDAAGAYTLFISNAWGMATGMALVTIKSEPFIEYYYDEYHQIADSGIGVFTRAYGALPLALQWYKDGVRMVGETNETLLLYSLENNTFLTTNDSGAYSLVAQNSFGVVSNLIFTLVVYNPPKIAIAPGRTVPVGSTITFSAIVDGPVQEMYWYRGGVLGYGPSYIVENANPSTANNLTLYVNYGGSPGILNVPSPWVNVVPHIVLATPSVAGNGDLSFQILSGTLSTQIIIQASQNLTNWAPVATMTATGGVARYTQPAGSPLTNRFFRALGMP